MEKEDLLKIVGDDEFGLLTVKPKVSAISVDGRLIESFNQINDFYRHHGKEPSANPHDILEYQLYSRLSGLRSNTAKREVLADLDIFNLLNAPPEKKIDSVSDIFEDDDLGLLDDDAESIFKIRNVPKLIDRPDHIAKRRPCKEFNKFESLFKDCHAELKAGIREARTFTGEQQIKEGHFFVLHGIMAYVASVGERENKNGKINARLRLIFENGTESNMLLRSLATELYKDETGRRILDHHDKALEDLKQTDDGDKVTGYIIVLLRSCLSLRRSEPGSMPSTNWPRISLAFSLASDKLTV